MDIREGLKQIKNTDNILVSGTTEIIYDNGKFWLNGGDFMGQIQYIPIEFEVLDWEVKSPEPTLKDMLSKLKVKEFEFDKGNFAISYYCDSSERRWYRDYRSCCKSLGTVYFEKHMVSEVIEYMNSKRISLEEFIATWEEIQRERGE